MLNNRNSINKWINFCYNHNSKPGRPGNFIFLLWGEDEMLARHIYNNFKELWYSEGNPEAMMDFYCYLDEEKQDELTKWVEENYE